MEKAVILSEGTRLTAKDIKTEHTQAASAPAGNLRAISDDEEERLVRQAMERTGGNISAAAKMLGVSRPTLYTKLKKYGL
jgi:transcriptional regulator of acetoin/glycerol metabolism